MDLKSNHDASRPTIRHGEVYFVPIKTIPQVGSDFEITGGRYIVGHSETGHHHTIAATSGVAVMEPPADFRPPEGMRVLYALIKEPGVKVEHNRDTHRHADTLLQPGTYEIRTQRNMTPEGWRRAVD